jgi:predicted dehydrogenase
MKIGVLGLGFMGSTHLKAWKNIPQAKVVAVASDIPERLSGDLSSVQGNIGGPGEKMDFSQLHKYADCFDALKDPDVDAVDLCLPTHMHASVTIAALKAGKHVLVEKPMAITTRETEEMIAAAKAAGKTLMTAQVLRFLPCYSKTAAMVRSNELGPIRSAIFRRRCAAPAWSQWLSDKSLSGGGVFDLLIHDLDYCVHAFGKPEAISAVGHEDLPRGIDWVMAQLYYRDIPAVFISGGWHHPKAFPFSMEYTVIGDCGTVEYSSSGRPMTYYRADGKEEELKLPEVDHYQAELEYFIDCCIEGRKPEMCPPEESAAGVRLANLMLESRSRGGEKLAVA